MLFARIILALIAVGAGAADWLLWDAVKDNSGNPTLGRMFIVWASALFALPAIAVFLLSFLKGTIKDGKILVGKDHSIIKFATFWCDREAEKDDSILKKLNVCGLFWLTWFSLSVSFGVIAMAAGAVFCGIAVIKSIAGDAPLHFRNGIQHPWIALCSIIVCIGSFTGAFVAGVKTQSKAGKWFFFGLSGAILVGFGGFCAPMLEFTEQMPFSEALSAYWAALQKNGLMYAGIILGFIVGIALVLGMIFGMFVGIKSLRTTVIGKILSEGWKAFKTRTCPVVSVIGIEKGPVKETANGNAG